MGFTSIDDFVSSVSTDGHFWRQDFTKLINTGACVAGNCYDLWQGNGNPAQYLHGNLVTNWDCVASPLPWVLGTANWSYTPGTHLFTRAANADVSTLSQTIRVTPGCYYMVTYSMGWTAGTCTVSLGGTSGTPRGSAATWREVLLCGTTDRTIKFTPNAAGNFTVDMVSVQPLNGTFVPYSDAMPEGVLWHGGDVYPDTKHLVNFGCWVNAASVPNIMYLVDVLGVYPRIRMDKTANTVHNVGGNSIDGCRLFDCQSAGGFNEQVISNVTQSLVNKATEGVPGGYLLNASCAKIAVGASFGTGIIASKVVALLTQSFDYTYSKYVYMDVRSSVPIPHGALSWCTDEHANLASSQDVTFPALPANTWTQVRLDVSGIALTDKDTVISIGFKISQDFGAFNLYVDEIEWTMPDYNVTNGTFNGNATGWTLNYGWGYFNNSVSHMPASGIAALEQTLMPITPKCPYLVTFTVASGTAGSITPSLGGASGVMTPVASGNTYKQVITCGTSNYTLGFTPTDDFDGALDDILCEPLMPRSDYGTVNYGAGNKMYYVMDNVLSNGVQTANVDIRYINSAGVSGVPQRSLGGTVINMSADVAGHQPHSGAGAGKYGPFLPLQAGDTGLQQVETLAFSGAATNADSAVDVVVCKIIASIPITTAQVACERDLLNQLPSLPRIRDGACLQLVHYAGMVTVQGTVFQGYCDFAWS